ncbi:murein L,D-transpeptidase catalytic domain family protein [Hymenobacter lapidiphilus]|uniref:Murein L,D-transpeptidase catalytic domain family protein n=1 Tax=Hymenobacter lapidiphilus TaxID=2608003 RepID=A0A7Y7U4S5_9BACT|nr:murein L,D-transpeptidase catalytic domain family protein [Hymenobacter lapidiphilus]NVO29730.1 murein L,D-transpeptidase catalytic domain family protein [Hymenobacter lapidiphilus]
MTKLPTLTAGFILTLFSSFTPAGRVLIGLGVAPAEVVATVPAGSGLPVLALLTPAERTSYLAAFEQYVAHTYVRAGLTGAALPLPVYRQALLGFYNLQQQGHVEAGTRTLTIADFSQSSNRERLWVVDVTEGRLLHHTLVAHGKNTGEEFARNFSNVEGSEKSSLGFYVTGPTYQGKHGLSLRLRGVDAGYNTNARTRAIVVHGADYVSKAFVSRHGRLGRSQGCPALPAPESAAIIRTIKNGTVLYIHGPAQVGYRSALLELDAALMAFARGQQRLTSQPG